MTKKDEKKFAYSEVKGLILMGISLIMFLSLLSFHADNPKENWLGLIGFGIGFSLYYGFGLASFCFAAFLQYVGLQLLIYGKMEKFKSKTIYFGLFLISTCIVLNLIAEQAQAIPSLLANKIYTEHLFLQLPYAHYLTRYNLGGVPFYFLYKDLPNFNLQHILSNVGMTLTFSITMFVSFLLLTEIQLFSIGEKLKKIFNQLKPLLQRLWVRFKKPSDDILNLKTVEKSSAQEIEKTLMRSYPPPIYPPLPTEKTSVVKELPKIAPVRRQNALNAQRRANGDFSTYQLPPPSLLKTPKKIDHPSLKKDLKRQAEILEETLMSFGIEAKVGEIYSGPTITSFEVHPAVGVKVQKIKALENDIALNLQATSIRIIAPIPGKAAVGVEIPSLSPQEVSFKELLLAYQQQNRKFHVPVLLGKSVSGENVMADLAKMPHCLIAGATGSGKSVCINTVILSILMTARPDEIKLLMIDPKKVELTAYSELPHMIAPVITEAHGAYAALNWLVKEMQLRYEILKQLGMRNITGFNQRKINPELEASLSIPIPQTMHIIIAIIDEFADLMMASSSDLETPIARIAQMARAVGIHLILATQRPSREIITGLIKANFPTRIAFKVSSRINSQIIMDDTGAESLLGNGDMLFMPPGTSQLMRAQGAYISDDEINDIISFICKQAPTQYLIPSFDSMRKEDFSGSKESEEGAKDSLYDEAKSIVVETGNASTTFLQRKLKIGYARAASLMDELEQKGIIGPQEGAKPRRILVSAQKLKSASSLEDE